MFKKQITYTDFNGTERKEDYYFHMSVPEATRLEAKLGGMPMDIYAQTLSADKDADKMVAFIENIILSSYGKKSDDGKSFLKTPAVRTEFEYSQAYAELFEELLTHPETAAKFASGVATQTKNMHKESATPKVVEQEDQE